jgi:CBS domain-containing protein
MSGDTEARPNDARPAFVSPRTLLEQVRPILPPRSFTALDREQLDGLRTIRAFLKARTSYDVLPISYRLIILDTALRVQKSLNILTQNGIVSAPLWDSKTSTFAGLLTTADYINVIQYYWQNPDALQKVDKFRLSSLREIEKALGVKPIETISIHPDRPVYEACRKMLESRARRIPVVDIDDETKRTMVVSVITQYRILKFIAVNVKETQKLRKPLREMNVGTYQDIATCYMDTPVMDVIHMLVKKNISSVPIVDKQGTVLNVFESVDVIALIKGGSYDDLNLTVGDALLKRSAVSLYRVQFKPPTLTPHRTSPASSPAPCKTACPPSTTPSASRACTASSSSMRMPSCVAC